MFPSSHDLTVVTTVVAMAAVVFLATALLLGRWVVARSRELALAACVFGDGGDFFAPGRTATAELADLSRESAATSAKLAECRDRERALKSSRRELVAWLARRGRWLSYSVGMVVTEAVHHHVLQIPASAWTPAVESNGEVRDGAWVAELTGGVREGWPPDGMQLIVCKELPRPGAQLRITDANGMRLTCFAATDVVGVMSSR